MKTRGVTNLGVRELIPHPDNPRKDIGDITELAESIRKNGVLQNLTVIPIDADGNTTDINNADKYMVIIGHRRLEAAKAAGLSVIPCRIVENLTHEEQILMMLEENIQREDLSIYDQAQGFQMMLDLGQTVEDIEKKSGFSKTTIYHRLNIAKLDKDTLMEKQEDDSFQLSMSDLYELEKVKDVEKRNEILSKSRNSNEIKYQAQRVQAEEKKLKKTKEITDKLIAAGVVEMPEDKKTWNCINLSNISYEDESFDIPEDAEYYYLNYSGVGLYKDKPPVEEKDTSLYDRKEEKRKEIENLTEDVGDSFIMALEKIVEGKLTVDDTLKGCEYMLNIMSFIKPEFDWEKMVESWAEIMNIGMPAEGEEQEFAEDTAKDILSLPLYRRMALGLVDGYIYPFYSVYRKEFDKEELSNYYKIIENLKPFGYVLTDEHKKLLEGTHPIFKEYEDALNEYQNS